MNKNTSLIGQKFGRLKVIGLSGTKKFPSGKSCSLLRCLCDCGNIVCVRADLLKQGYTKSCGCWRKEKLAERFCRLNKSHVVHGMEKTKIYQVWRGMKNRCLNPNAEQFKRYGGRGIKICDEWLNNFQAFYDYVSKLEHYGEEGYTLDRINANGNYTEGNVKWSTAKEQARNRRNNIVVDYKGQKMTVAQAAEESGIRVSVLYGRIRRHGVNYENLFSAET